MKRFYFSKLIIVIAILSGWDRSAFAQTTFAVPNIPGCSGVSGVIVNMRGGQGGSTNGGGTPGSTGAVGVGGYGGSVVCTLNVITPTIITSLTYYVGMQGAAGLFVPTGTTGAFGGTGYGTGGNGGNFTGPTGAVGNDLSGGGGGGSSAVLNTTGSVVLMVAAGGGGGGTQAPNTNGGFGGNPGTAGQGYAPDNYGGAGGTAGAGGAGGIGLNNNGIAGGAVPPGNGGNGGIGQTGSQSGGGGGAGWGGGGGGGAGNTALVGTLDGVNTPSAAGGGGCNYVNPACVTTGLTNGTAGVTGNGAVTLTLYPAPIGGTCITLCPGVSTTFTEATPGGVWSSSNPTIASVSSTTGSPITVTAGASAGTATISYTEPSGYYAFVIVTVLSATSSVTGPSSVCVGQTIHLSDATPGATWSSSTPGVATVSTTGAVTGVSNGVTNITYTLPAGCPATFSVTVISSPPITGITAMCLPGGTTLLSDADPGGTWASANPGIATVTTSTGIVYGVTSGVATISYTITLGCFSTIPVNVHPQPAPPAVTAIAYCQYLPANSLTPVGPTYRWWGPGVTPGTTTAPTPSTNVPGMTDYYVTQTSSFGCESDSAVLVVTVNPKPAPPIIRDTAYCQYLDNPALLTAMVDSLAGSRLSWFNATMTALSFVDTPSTLNPTYPDSLKWYVSQTITATTCTSDTVPVKVEIVPKPDFYINARPWVCQFDSIQLLYSSLIPAIPEPTYLWSLPMGASFANGTLDSDQNIYAQFDSANQNYFIVSLTVSDLNGFCTSDTSIQITVVPQPGAIAFSKADVCLSDTVTLALSSKSSDAINFNWYIDNDPLFSSPAATIIAANANSGGPYSISWTDTGMHIIHVQTTTSQGCIDKPTADTVYVHPSPDASFNITTANGTLCLEDSVLFSANDSSYQNNYSWAPVKFFGNNNIDKYVVWGKVEASQSVVTLTVTDPFGCVGSSTKELDPGSCCNIVFPNAFSPNGDGKNDVFRPIPGTAYHVYHSFVVENRWGQVVFESSNNQASWDGTFNGIPQDIGVYYYYLKYDCGGNTLEQKGDVTLVK